MSLLASTVTSSSTDRDHSIATSVSFVADLSKKETTSQIAEGDGKSASTSTSCVDSSEQKSCAKDDVI